MNENVQIARERRACRSTRVPRRRHQLPKRTIRERRVVACDRVRWSRVTCRFDPNLRVSGIRRTYDPKTKTKTNRSESKPSAFEGIDSTRSFRSHPSWRVGRGKDVTGQGGRSRFRKGMVSYRASLLKGNEGWVPVRCGSFLLRFHETEDDAKGHVFSIVT